MLRRPLGPPYVRIHIYNETPSRLKQQRIQRQEREREREREKGKENEREREREKEERERVNSLIRARIRRVTGRRQSAPRRRPISDDRYIIFCTLRAFLRVHSTRLHPHRFHPFCCLSARRLSLPSSVKKNADATKSRTCGLTNARRVLCPALIRGYVFVLADVISPRLEIGSRNASRAIPLSSPGAIMNGRRADHA